MQLRLALIVFTLSQVLNAAAKPDEFFGLRLGMDEMAAKKSLEQKGVRDYYDYDLKQLNGKNTPYESFIEMQSKLPQWCIKTSHPNKKSIYQCKFNQAVTPVEEIGTDFQNGKMYQLRAKFRATQGKSSLEAINGKYGTPVREIPAGELSSQTGCPPQTVCQTAVWSSPDLRFILKVVFSGKSLKTGVAHALVLADTAE